MRFLAMVARSRRSDLKLWTGSPASVLLLRAFSSARSERRAGATMDARRASAFLLIVTPLQKIHVIEPHVAAVGFVHNDDGRHSMLRNLTIDEYRAERAARAAASTS